MRFGSLFSGIGGFDLGLERAGHTAAWQCEIDPFCQHVLARHWPGVQRFSDVRIRWGDTPTVRSSGDGDAAGWERRDSVPECDIDLLVGGFPCQDLSVAGKRAGLAGARSGLFWEFLRLARLLRPRWLLLENVPGLLTSHRGRDFAAVLGGLADSGYGWAYRVLDSQHFGVAQRRRRVFIVGHRGGECPPAVLFEPTRGGGHSAASREAGADVAYALAAGVGNRFGSGRDAADTFVTGALNMTKERGGWRAGPDEAMAGQLIPCDTTQITSAANYSAPAPGDPCHPLASGAHPPAIAMNLRGREEGARARAEFSDKASLRAADGGSSRSYIAHTLKAEGHDASEDGTGRGVPLLAFDPTTSLDQAPNGHTAPPLKQGTGLELGWAPAIMFDTYNQSTGAVAHTLRVSIQSTPHVSSGAMVRRLTPTECERLQGFPDGWTCTCGVAPYTTATCRCPDSPRYRALGNAVTVPVIEWIGRRLPR